MTASLPMPLSEKSVTASAAWPPTAASKALPPMARIWRAASVASAFMEATAAWRPRITGRMVWVVSSLCARNWGTSARKRREPRNVLTRDGFRNIGLCDLIWRFVSWNPTFRKERERWGTRRFVRSRLKSKPGRTGVSAPHEFAPYWPSIRRPNSILGGGFSPLRILGGRRRRLRATTPSAFGRENDHKPLRRKSREGSLAAFEVPLRSGSSSLLHQSRHHERRFFHARFFAATENADPLPHGLDQH